MDTNYSTFLSDKKLSAESLQAEIDKVNARLKQLADENKYSDPEYAELNQDLASLNDFLDTVKSFETSLQGLEDAKEMLNDPDMAELAQDEINEQEDTLSTLHAKLLSLTQVKLPNDDKKAIVEFRPGVGGVEASLFAEDLYRMYLRYCNSNNYPIQQLSLDYNEEGGIKEASFLIDTKNAFGEFRFESGVHRVQRVPSTESSGRIHTSSASIVVMPQFDKVEIEINPEELRIDVYRSSGPGGQSVNTTDSAVRITHLPTGITVSCQNGKSQHKNKEMAMGILASRLQEIEDEKKMEAEKKTRLQSIKGGDRSAKIRTYNFPQSRVTDHRITTSWHNLDAIMNGEIEEVVKTVNSKLRLELED